MVWRLLLILMLVLMRVPGVTQAQGRCDLPAGYLDTISADLQNYGTAIARLDVEDGTRLAPFFLELAQLRQRYEEMVMPDCALRLHGAVLAVISGMQDMVGVAMALMVDPAQEATYLTEMNSLTARIQELSPAIEREITFTQRPAPIAIRYIEAEAVNVRSAPGPDKDILGVLERGAAIEIVALDLDENNNSWYKIYYGEDTGWVLSQLTTSTRPE